jgi:hypothetical protein
VIGASFEQTASMVGCRGCGVAFQRGASVAPDKPCPRCDVSALVVLQLVTCDTREVWPEPRPLVVGEVFVPDPVEAA